MPDPFIRNLCVSWPFEDCAQANDATCILPMEEDVEKVLRSHKPDNRFDKRETRGETSIGRAFWACAMCERATHHRWILYLWIEQEEIKTRPERG